MLNGLRTTNGVEHRKPEDFGEIRLRKGPRGGTNSIQSRLPSSPQTALPQLRRRPPLPLVHAYERKVLVLRPEIRARTRLLPGRHLRQLRLDLSHHDGSLPDPAHRPGLPEPVRPAPADHLRGPVSDLLPPLRASVVAGV